MDFACLRLSSQIWVKQTQPAGNDNQAQADTE